MPSTTVFSIHRSQAIRLAAPVRLPDKVKRVDERTRGCEHSNAPEQPGPLIGLNNLHIAAHARSASLRLMSDKLRAFERVHALQLTNWIN